jgi:cell wall-associated NlpC family hydrolase
MNIGEVTLTAPFCFSFPLDLWSCSASLLTEKVAEEGTYERRGVRCCTADIRAAAAAAVVVAVVTAAAAADAVRVQAAVDAVDAVAMARLVQASAVTGTDSSVPQIADSTEQTCAPRSAARTRTSSLRPERTTRSSPCGVAARASWLGSESTEGFSAVAAAEEQGVGQRSATHALSRPR